MVLYLLDMDYIKMLNLNLILIFKVSLEKHLKYTLKVKYGILWFIHKLDY